MNTKHEIWARSYAQWIATKSDDTRMLKQLDALRNDTPHPVQWGDASFEPISKEIDTLFRKLG